MWIQFCCSLGYSNQECISPGTCVSASCWRWLLGIQIRLVMISSSLFSKDYKEILSGGTCDIMENVHRKHCEVLSINLLGFTSNFSSLQPWFAKEWGPEIKRSEIEDRNWFMGSQDYVMNVSIPVCWALGTVQLNEGLGWIQPWCSQNSFLYSVTVMESTTLHLGLRHVGECAVVLSGDPDES